MCGLRGMWPMSGGARWKPSPFLQTPQVRVASTCGLISGSLLLNRKDFKLNTIRTLCCSEPYSLDTTQMSVTFLVTLAAATSSLEDLGEGWQLGSPHHPRLLVTSGLALI